MFYIFLHVSATPQGVLPLLEVDGKVLLYQSFAILRYAGRECSKPGCSTVKPVLSDHIKQYICLAFTTGGYLLLHDSRCRKLQKLSALLPFSIKQLIAA